MGRTLQQNARIAQYVDLDLWIFSRNIETMKAGLHVRRKHKHKYKPRVNRDDASTSARKRNARLCLCLRRTGSHVAYACACVVRVNQPLWLNLQSNVRNLFANACEGLQRVNAKLSDPLACVALHAIDMCNRLFSTSIIEKSYIVCFQMHAVCWHGNQDKEFR